MINGILNCFTFLFGALSDQIGQKKVFQTLLFSQFIQVAFWIITVQFDLSPWILQYSTLIFTLSGSFPALFATDWKLIS